MKILRNDWNYLPFAKKVLTVALVAERMLRLIVDRFVKVAFPKLKAARPTKYYFFQYYIFKDAVAFSNLVSRHLHRRNSVSTANGVS